jgi:hypothetical protein
MKNIIPSLNKVQLACMDRSAGSLNRLGQARKELFAAIREAIIGYAAEVETGTPTIAKERADYLAKFDKLNGD